MSKHGGKIGAGISLFLFGAVALLATQNTPPPARTTPAQEPASASASVPDHARAYYHFTLARRYREMAGAFNRGDYIDRAISEYKQAMEADPESLFLRIELAELYARVSRVADAIREAEAVLKIDPDYPDAHRLLARIYWHSLGENQPDQATKESLGKAVEHLEALVRLDPADLDSQLTLGRLYKVTNQPAKAEALFKKLLNDDPTSRSALANLAQLYFDRGDYDQAVDLLQKIPENALDPSLLGMLGYAYLQTHDFAKAIAAYEKGLALEPDNLDLRRVYAEGLMSAGKTVEARVELEKILRLEPQDGSTCLRLAQLDRQQGHFDKARLELERAKTLMPDSAEVTYHQAFSVDTAQVKVVRVQRQSLLIGGDGLVEIVRLQVGVTQHPEQGRIHRTFGYLLKQVDSLLIIPTIKIKLRQVGQGAPGSRVIVQQFLEELFGFGGLVGRLIEPSEGERRLQILRIQADEGFQVFNSFAQAFFSGMVGLVLRQRMPVDARQ